MIAKTPGVGPKLAQKLCLELGDKMAEFVFAQRTERKAAGQQTAAENSAFEDAVDGLVGLGYSRTDARRAVDRAMANATHRSDASALITAGLALLNAKR
jgi:Holliday junction DNA helicase RuvA